MRDEAQAALTRAEAEQRSRVTAERQARLLAEQERARAEEAAREEERERAVAAERARAVQATETDERLRLERAKSALELCLAEQERSMQLSELRSQAARFRDRAIAWISGGLTLFVILATIGVYYGKIQPERVALESTQSSLLAAQTKRADEAEGLLLKLRQRSDELSGEVSSLHQQLRDAKSAVPVAPAHEGARGPRPTPVHTPIHHAPCPEPPDPINPCL